MRLSHLFLYLFIAGLLLGAFWLFFPNHNEPAITTVSSFKPDTVTASPSTIHSSTQTTNTAQTPDINIALLQWRWHEGDQQIYRYNSTFQVKNQSDMAGKTTETVTTVVLEGLLNMRVFQRTDQEISVGFQLSPLHFRIAEKSIASFEKLLGQFFIVVFSLEGKPIRFHFPQTIAENNQPLVTELIQSVQAIIPTGIATQWQSLEQHNTGTYSAKYQRRVNEIEKHKTAYTELKALSQFSNFSSPEIEMNIEIEQSNIRFTPAKQQSWLATFHAEERLRFYASSSPKETMNVSSHVLQLTLTDEKPDLQLAIWQANNDINQVIQAFNQQSGDVQDVLVDLELQQLRNRFAGVSFNDLTTDLVLAVLNQQATTVTMQHFYDLSDYLRAYPEKSGDVLTALQGQEAIPLEASALLIGALNMAGTSEGQTVLANIMTQIQDNHSPYILQAMATTAQVANPSETLVNALWQRAEQQDAIAGVALEVLGGTAKHLLEVGNIQAAEQITKQLTLHLNNTQTATITPSETTPPTTLSLLRALGNSGHPDVFSIIVPYITSADAEARLLAYRSLRHAQDAESLKALINALSQETDVEARRQAVLTLTERQDSTQAVNPICDLLAKEPEIDVRAEMLRFLGRHKADNPRVLNVLQQQLTRESSRDMKKAIYQAIYTE
ncbi:hypothetical protein BegalDRAFT_2859 [Beggiatoa alba B18LD]|uniref:Vitellogenin domain-containing protein n=1 Tax=Beggiatoa alba B18LD TaxID=395493 RepID=I3CJ99_9GAMM|nr:HEAT repeat domain-containing protein [Beggiatoa alba]EIJ43692.1 hypothetical protein BegalDRAFT_2859 [Beggiatoa alba B18LD]